jgi:2-keto-4-pentenoate hydratase/2-oxohepta-3-ene-1,7-dioic acid hydratase in catechol pathway
MRLSIPVLNSIRFEKRQVTPGKVVCVGRNFVEHISELGNEVPEQMVIFVKPNSAISDTLVIGTDEEIHYEGEISFLVEQGKYVAVAFGLDLTKRALQSTLKAKGLPWERAKAFDRSALFSEFVSLPSNPEQLELLLQINGTTVQQGKAKQMIYRPATILEEVQTFMSLQDGDIVMTGTPKGVGQLHSGDKLHGELLADGKRLVSSNWNAA